MMVYVIPLDLTACSARHLARNQWRSACSAAPAPEM